MELIWNFATEIKIEQQLDYDFEFVGTRLQELSKTNRSPKVRVEQHVKAVIRGEAMKKVMADHESRENKSSLKRVFSDFDVLILLIWAFFICASMETNALLLRVSAFPYMFPVSRFELSLCAYRYLCLLCIWGAVTHYCCPLASTYLLMHS